MTPKEFYKEKKNARFVSRFWSFCE